MAVGRYIWNIIFWIALMALLCACGGGTSRSSAAAVSVNTDSGSSSAEKKPERAGPVNYSYSVKNIYPHSITSYTQGLCWHDGCLLEGTGQHGQSALMKIDLVSGRALETVKLSDDYFGEGIAMLNGNIYQLTWLDGVCVIYDAATFKKTGEFRYRGQGWGLTTDGEMLYMSNGSHEIFVLDPTNFDVKRVIEVGVGRRKMSNLNELEWIDGKIWANIYMSDQIVIIDPQTGNVEGVVDMDGLLPRAERLPDTDVLNGIAYDEQGGRIFVTGKNWPKVFEIEIDGNQEL